MADHTVEFRLDDGGESYRSQRRTESPRSSTGESPRSSSGSSSVQTQPTPVSQFQPPMSEMEHLISIHETSIEEILKKSYSEVSRLLQEARPDFLKKTVQVPETAPTSTATMTPVSQRPEISQSRVNSPLSQEYIRRNTPQAPAPSPATAETPRTPTTTEFRATTAAGSDRGGIPPVVPPSSSSSPSGGGGGNPRPSFPVPATGAPRPTPTPTATPAPVAAAGTAAATTLGLVSIAAVGVYHSLLLLNTAAQNVYEWLNKMSDDLAPFEFTLAVSKARSAVMMLEADIRNAQRLGPDLAKFTDANTELQLAVKNIGADLAKIILPIATDILSDIAKLVSFVERVTELLSKIDPNITKQIAGGVAGSIAPNMTMLVKLLDYLINLVETPKPQDPNLLTAIDDFLNPVKFAAGFRPQPPGRIPPRGIGLP